MSQWSFNILRILEFSDVSFKDPGCDDGTAAEVIYKYNIITYIYIYWMQ